MGETQLAAWLKTPSSRAKIIERHQLVTELRDKLDLQHDLAVTGEELRARLNPESLVAWAEGKREMPAAIWHFAAARWARSRPICSICRSSISRI